MIRVDIHNEFDIQLNKSSIQGLLENILSSTFLKLG